MLSGLLFFFYRVRLIVTGSGACNSRMDFFRFKFELVLVLNLPLLLLFQGKFCFFVLNFYYRRLTDDFAGRTFANAAFFLLVSLLMGRLRLLNLTCFTLFILRVVFTLFLSLLVGITRIGLVFI